VKFIKGIASFVFGLAVIVGALNVVLADAQTVP